MLRSFLQKRARRADPVPPVPLVLYTRPGCHLCEVMQEQIAGARLPRAFELSLVDIAGDPELEARHGRSIPVLEIGGRTAFKGRLTLDELRRKFERLAGEWDAARPGGD